MGSQPAILMPDAELSVIQGLRQAITGRPETHLLAGLQFGKALPAASIGRFGWVRRSGGVAGLLVDVPRVEVQVWHDTDETQMGCARLLLALLHSLAGTTVSATTWCRVADFAGPHRMPDSVNVNRSIVSFTVEVSLRGTALG